MPLYNTSGPNISGNLTAHTFPIAGTGNSLADSLLKRDGDSLLWNDEEVLTGTVSAAQIEDGAVGASEIASNAVTSAKMADGSVTTSKVADGAITSVKLADSAVTGGKLDNYNARQADLTWILERLRAWGSKSSLSASVELLTATTATVRRALGGLDFEKLDFIRTNTSYPWTLRGQAIMRDAAWIHLSTYESVTAGTWSPVHSTTYCGGVIIQNATDSGTQTLTRTVTGQGQLWLRFTRRTSAGFTYVSVKDQFGAERCALPLSGANHYYDGYGASDLVDDVVMIASGLEQGTYTVMLTKQASEKNASSSGFRSLPVALAWVDANAPSFGSPEAIRVRSLPRYCVTEVGPTLTNRHNASSIATSCDFSSVTFSTGDAIYVGGHVLAGHEIVGVDLQLSTPNSNASTLSVELWDGSAFTPVTATDGTNGLRQSGRITFATPPSTMNSTAVNGLTAYWVKLEVASTASSAVSLSGLAIVTRATSAPLTVATLIGNITEVGYAVDVRYNNVWAEGGGQAHGMETSTAQVVVVDGQAVGVGRYARGSAVTFRDTGNLVHPEGTIGTFRRETRVSRDGVSIDGTWAFTQAVTVGQGSGAGTIGNSFPAMWACGLSSAGSWLMRRAAVLKRPLVVRDLTTATSRTTFDTGSDGIGWAWSDPAHDYAVLAWMSRAADTLNGGGDSNVYLDANRANVAIPANGSDCKGYAQMAERSFASGESFNMGVSAITIRRPEALQALR